MIATAPFIIGSTWRPPGFHGTVTSLRRCASSGSFEPTVFGTPVDATLSELALERLYPADERPRAVLQQLGA